MAMFGAASFEQPVPCVLDAHDVDRLLVRLHAVHGKPRYQGAMALNAVSVAEEILTARPRSRQSCGLNNGARQATASRAPNYAI